MCPFYSAQLFEITGTTKGVFTHSQSSCHIAKVVLALDSRQIPIASDAPPRHTFRGFLHWRFADAGPGARGAVIMRPASENLHTTDWCAAANSISSRQFFDRAGASLREFELGVCFRSSAGFAQKENATGHLSVIFEKPSVAFKAQSICVKSPTIQVEFEIKRSSTTTLSAVASASIASDRSRRHGDGEMR